MLPEPEELSEILRDPPSLPVRGFEFVDGGDTSGEVASAGGEEEEHYGGVEAADVLLVHVLDVHDKHEILQQPHAVVEA